MRFSKIVLGAALALAFAPEAHAAGFMLYCAGPLKNVYRDSLPFTWVLHSGVGKGMPGNPPAASHCGWPDRAPKDDEVNIKDIVGWGGSVPADKYAGFCVKSDVPHFTYVSGPVWIKDGDNIPSDAQPC